MLSVYVNFVSISIGWTGSTLDFYHTYTHSPGALQCPCPQPGAHIAENKFSMCLPNHIILGILIIKILYNNTCVHMCLCCISLTFVTEHSSPTRLTFAFKGQLTVSIHTTWKTNAMWAVSAHPPYFASTGIRTSAIALTWYTIIVANRSCTHLMFIRPTRKASNITMFITDVMICSLQVRYAKINCNEIRIKRGIKEFA